MTTIGLPSAEALSGPEGPERLHRTLDELNKSIPDDLAGTFQTLQETVATQQETIATLQDTLVTLQAQVDAIPVVRTKTVLIDEADVVANNVITHDFGTKEVFVSTHTDTTPTSTPYTVEVSENTVGVSSTGGVMTSDLRVNILTIQ